MALSFRSLFHSSTAPKKAAEQPAADQKEPSKLVICGGAEFRQVLNRSSKWHVLWFSRLGAELAIFANRVQAAAVVLEYAPELPVLEALEIMSSELPDCPCLIFCDRTEHAALKQAGWKALTLIDRSSLTEMEEKIDRVLLLHPWMKRPELHRVTGDMRNLPTRAVNNQRIIELLRDSKSSLKMVADLIKQDPALMAQLLKIVNSVVFGLSQPIHNVSEAVVMLGTMRLQALVTSAWAFSLIDDETCPGFSPEREWNHAVAVTARTQALAEEHGASELDTDLMFIAAMLHDIGKLLLAANIPMDYSQVITAAKNSSQPLWKVESSMFNFHHGEVGGCMLGLWGLPLPVVEAVLLHHSPDLPREPHPSIAALVQMADEQVGEPANEGQQS